MEYRQGKATTEDLKSWLHTASSESAHQDEKPGNINYAEHLLQYFTAHDIKDKTKHD